MSIRYTIFAALAFTALAADDASADQLISSFEGDFSSTFGIDWDTSFNGVISTAFVTDDPGDADTEGVTEGAQALDLGHSNWDATFFPAIELAGGASIAQAIVDNDFMEIDVTPLVNLAGPGFNFRQAFFSMSSNNFNFGVVKRDYAAPGFDATGQPQTATLQWDLDEDVNEDDMGLTGVVKSFREIAQEVLDSGAAGSLTLRFIFQGTNIDFFEPVRTGVDNIRLVSGGGLSGVTGDYNNDSVVDVADYTLWRDNLGGAEDALQNRDTNLSGQIGIDDYLAWKVNFGNPPGAGAISATPEPASMLLLALASIIGFSRRAR